MNVSCPAPPGAARPLVLLDASLSMGARGGAWATALADARGTGEVRFIGDERPGGTATEDSLPTRGRSRVAPALRAAAASDRPVVLLTDGEVDDAADLEPEVLARATVRVLPRTPVPDLAITRVAGPARLTIGDTLRLEVDLASSLPARDTVTVDVRLGTSALGRRVARLAGGVGHLRIALATAGLPAGDQLLSIRIAPGDSEPRTDVRLHALRLISSPGIVLAADPVDYEARYLYRALKDVANLPIKGVVRLGDRWREMDGLAPVAEATVRQQLRAADLVVLLGSATSLGASLPAAARWLVPGAAGAEPPVPGDWYVSAAAASPVAGAFAGLPLDSFPPLTALAPLLPAEGDWVALTAKEGRRGADRPVMIGREAGGRRTVTLAADGLWRWAFRGGSSEQAYRSWVAATLSWLVGGSTPGSAAALPVHGVVQQGRPVTFVWSGTGSARPVGIRWSGAVTRVDTLRFDGAGVAAQWLPPGESRYALEGGGSGVVGVEQYSDELLPHPRTLGAREGRAAASDGRRAARDQLWLFGIAVLALSAEWFQRRRLGLR